MASQRTQLSRVYGWVGSFILAVATSSAWAHPFHTSVAELDWNASTHRWEVSVRIHAGDLELALAQIAGKKVDIESTQATEWIRQYVESHFLIAPQAELEKLNSQSELSTKLVAPKQGSSRMEWIGQEFEGGWMWLYFELQPPEMDQPLALVSQLLTDINEDQINIVSIRGATKKRVAHQTSRKQTWIALQ